ncbi:hypothetical protein [Embleya sp. NPDC005971]|uniref:hypothetical protein n=1 Tax=Embleya sp. NPDC005971 TaxID=3156724 RepID=UPI0033D71C26
MPATLHGEFESISLGSLPLHVEDDSGIDWLVTDLQGWWDSPGVTLDVQQRTADHGGWGGGSWLTPRTITLQGEILAPDRATLLAAVDRVHAAASLGPTTLRVVEPGSLDRSCAVRRAGPVAVATLGASASWSVPLVAQDPRRYGAVVGPLTTHLPSTSGGLSLPAAPPWTIGATVVQGSVRVSNAGTIASRPTLRIDGPVQHPQVVVLDSGGGIRTLTYNATLAAGEWLVIDTDAHSVLIGGTVSRRGLVSGDWPEIPALSWADVQFRAAAYDAGALLTVSYRSAWM